MKQKQHKFYKVRLTLIACSLLILLLAELIYSEDWPAQMFISNIELQNLFQSNSSKMYMIDVRDQQKYNLIKIPASINMPLHTIKTKTFLKNKPIVLINSGFAYKRLISECQILSQKGFQSVHILKGGLNAWYRSGNRIDSNAFSLDDIFSITPVALYEDIEYKDIIIYEIHEKEITGQSIIPNAVCMMYHKNMADDLIQEISKLESEPLYIVVACDNARWHKEIEKGLRESIKSPFFFLKGGLRNYETFIKNQQAMWKYEHVIQTKKECGACN